MNKNVLAVVGGREITEADLQGMLQTLDPQTAAFFNSDSGRAQLVNELINQELLYLDAMENNYEKDAAFVNEMERLKVNILKQYSLSKLFSTITITPEETRNYYDENKEQFEQAESIRASHILVESADKANQIIAELQNGLSFADAAQQYSSCPSNAQGGDLGFFTQGRMVPEFEEAAFALDTDEVSAPVETQFGFHVIKVTDKKESGITPFEEVQDQIQNMLAQEKQQEAYYKKAEELSKKYQIQRNV